MKTFFNVTDLGDLQAALQEAHEVKRDRFAYQHLGKNKTLLMIFFNNSLRTRLSTQKAAMNLGMNVIVLDVNAGAWKLETERGVIMNGDKSEHLLEAIPVMGSYCDIIAVRSFAGLKDRDYDYAETVVNQFVRYSGRPVVAMETATVHPLQAFADLITIDEYKPVARPKVVLTWAPHCRALPQAVPNSFAEWMAAADVDLVITHPKGYELDPMFVGSSRVEYDQRKAFADLITIDEYKPVARPKVVLTWAPHCRALPQAVPNSFAEWMAAADVDLVITHPKGYELDPMFVGSSRVEYDQRKAFEGAHFIYAKNWSCPGVSNRDDYGKILSEDMGWTVDAEHMSWTDNAFFMHCLPVRRGLIVTDEVIESERSIVIPEAANREISAQVVLKRILESM